MSTPTAFNSANYLTAIKGMLSLGGHSVPVFEGTASSGRIQNIAVGATVATPILISFTSASTFEVAEASTPTVPFATGTVGNPLTSSVVNFTAVGAFAAGSTVALTVYPAPPILRDTATELVCAIQRGTATAYLAFTPTTLVGAPALLVGTGPAFNNTLPILSQADMQVAYMPYASAESLTAYHRFDGSTFTLRTSNGASVRTCSAGFLHSFLSPLDFSHPLYAGGPVNTSLQYAAHTFTNRSNFRTPSGTSTPIATTQSASMAVLDYWTPALDPLPLLPIHAHATGLNTFAHFPHVYLQPRNLNTSTIYYTQAEQLVPTYTNTSTDFGNTFLFSAQL